MAATKKTTPKKAKAPAKKPVGAAVKQRAPRKPAATPAQASTEQESMLTLMLVSLFAVLSVLFAVMAYWRYRM